MGKVYTNQSASGRSVSGRILEPTAVALTGDWVLLGGVGPVTVVANGDFTGVLNIRVSNRPIEDGTPGTAANMPLIGETLTQAGWIYVEGHFLWIMADFVTRTTGTLQGVDVYAGRP